MTQGAGAWYSKQPGGTKYYMLTSPRMGGPGLQDNAKLSDRITTWAIASLKAALLDQVEGTNMSAIGMFGKSADSTVKAFQSKHSLAADGIVGPKTAQALFKMYVTEQEQQYKIPTGLLCGLIGRNESGFDPGAVGYADDNDRGIAQINRVAHPDITDVTAFGDARSCIWWTAHRIAQFHQYFVDESYADAWGLAIAAHNNPAGASYVGQHGWDAAIAHNKDVYTALKEYVDRAKQGCPG